MLTITHTLETGTRLAGTEYGDRTASILKTHGWHWAPALCQWYLPGSHGGVPNEERIRSTKMALEANGHQVTADPKLVSRDADLRS